VDFSDFQALRQPVQHAKPGVLCRFVHVCANCTGGRVILPENKRLENWTSPALIIDGDENEQIEIYRVDPPKHLRHQSDCPSIQKDRIRTIIATDEERSA
jgi:hypothetical protein